MPSHAPSRSAAQTPSGSSIASIESRRGEKTIVSPSSGITLRPARSRGSGLARNSSLTCGSAMGPAIMQGLSGRKPPANGIRALDNRAKGGQESVLKPPKALGMAAEAHTAADIPRGDHTGNRACGRSDAMGVVRHGYRGWSRRSSRSRSRRSRSTSSRRSRSSAGILLLSDLSQQSVYGDAFVSPGSVAVLAAGAIVGLPAVVLLEALASLVGDASRRTAQLLHGVQQRHRTRLAGRRGELDPVRGRQARHRRVRAPRASERVAGLAYYVVNVALVTLAHRRRTSGDVRSSSSGRPPPGSHRTTWSTAFSPPASCSPTRASGLLGILVFAMPAAAMLIATGQYLRATEGLVEELRTKNQTLEALLGENRGLLASLSRGHLQLIRGLAQAIDAKDPYTAGHTSRVAQYSVRIAGALGLDDATRREIEHGALLHDIGKIGVPGCRALRSRARSTTTSGRRCGATRSSRSRSSTASSCRRPSSAWSATITRTSTAPATPITWRATTCRSRRASPASQTRSTR